jgi:hypothetical protein
MIHLALEVLAFLFLCWVGLIVLGIVAAIFDSIFGTSSKTSLTPHRLPPSKSPFALGHDPIEPNHDPRTCPLCLGGGHRDDIDLYARAPKGMSTDELYRWAARERERERAAPKQEIEQRKVETPQQGTPYQHIPGLAWGDPSSYVRASTPEELERAREGLAKREAQRREAEAAREREAVLEQERRKRDDEKREQEAREFLIREAERVQRERDEREAAEKREREAEANRTRWIH